jgi:hypothetical protein
VENATDIEKEHIALIKEAQEEAAEADRVFDRWIPTIDDLTDSQLEGAEAAAAVATELAKEQEELDALVAAIGKATGETFAMSSLQDSLAQSSRDLFDALVESETGLLGVGEAAENARAKAEAFADDFDDVMAKMVADKDTPTEMAGAFLAMKDELTLLGIEAGKSEEEMALLFESINNIPTEMDADFRFRLHIATITEGLDAITAGMSNEMASQLINQLAATGMLDMNFGVGATGGIVTQPTLALIGEGAGPEAVIPLNQMPGASPLGSMGGMGGGGVNVTVNVGGSVIGQDDLVETIQRELIRTKNRNGSLEF